MTEKETIELLNKARRSIKLIIHDIKNKEWHKETTILKIHIVETMIQQAEFYSTTNNYTSKELFQELDNTHKDAKKLLKSLRLLGYKQDAKIFFLKYKLKLKKLIYE